MIIHVASSVLVRQRAAPRVLLALHHRMSSIMAVTSQPWLRPRRQVRITQLQTVRTHHMATALTSESGGRLHNHRMVFKVAKNLVGLVFT